MLRAQKINQDPRKWPRAPRFVENMPEPAKLAVGRYLNDTLKYSLDKPMELRRCRRLARSGQLADALSRLISAGEARATIVEVVDRALHVPEDWLLTGNQLPKQKIGQLDKFVRKLEECAALIEADKGSLPAVSAPLSKNSALSYANANQLSELWAEPITVQLVFDGKRGDADAEVARKRMSSVAKIRINAHQLSLVHKKLAEAARVKIAELSKEAGQKDKGLTERVFAARELFQVFSKSAVRASQTLKAARNETIVVLVNLVGGFAGSMAIDLAFVRREKTRTGVSRTGDEARFLGAVSGRRPR